MTDHDESSRSDHNCDERMQPPESVTDEAATASSLGGGASADFTAPPERIGPYRVLEALGEGGMGVVYLAEQTEPVRRRVALKVIKPGMDSRAVLARFEAERQALAMMDHPNVAQVYGGGATPDGRPYFVMEHVPGVPITEHCDRQKLSVRDRLDLFMQVCAAVQHAHQKGIIHRDLKPSNILVAAREGEAVPKVIDFGVAKALHQRLTEKTLFTEQGQLIGTPEYMSPEQAEMTAQDIDTRSDIYSLGVLLYELLTGALPFEKGTLRIAALGEIQRIIREEAPPKPSTRLSSLGDASKTSARNRRAEPRSLASELRGDLDWIVMKCLEKDRARRYETANGLAVDLKRHLNNEPVLAGPPSAAYRMKKFVRRNRAGVTAAAIVFVVLLGGIIGTSWGLIQASASRKVAQTEAANAKAINDFLTDDLLAAVAPSTKAGKGKDVLMRDVLDEASKKIDEESEEGGKFADKPLIEASIRTTLGETYRQLGEYKRAEPHLKRALELRRKDLGEEHLDTLTSMTKLAILYDKQGRHDEAEALFVNTLEVNERIFGAEHPNTLNSMINLANLYQNEGQYGEAELLNVKTFEICQRIFGAEHPRTLTSMNNLALLFYHEGRYDDAEALNIKSLEIHKHIYGAEDLRTLDSMNNLALLYDHQGRYDEAEKLEVKTLEIRNRVLGAEHPKTLTTMNSLAGLYTRQGRYDEAEALYVKTLEIRKRVLGAEHPLTLNSMSNLAILYGKQGKMDDARPLVRTLNEIQLKRAEKTGASARDKNECAWTLLTCQPADLRDPETALRLARQAVDMTKSADPYFLDSLGLAQHLTGDTPGAIETEKKAISLLPPGPSATRTSLETSLAKYEAVLGPPQ